ncbi:hypothetical protein ACHWQZ_G009491 [Mnemiopsis leidyi]
MLVEPVVPPRDVYQFPSFSIFSPEPLEKVEDVEESEKYDGFERPPSPLEEVIQQPPKLYEQFLEILQERVKPNAACTNLSIEHQEGLISIIFSEVYTRWNSLCEAINDPHLTSAQNKKVHVMLFINVVEICQDLFANYLNKISKLEGKGVFSRSVNVSRIKGSLISEASKSLNVHRLRQKILQEFKTCNNSTPSTRKNGQDIDSKEDLLGYLDKIVPKTTSLTIDPGLSQKVNAIESKLRLSTLQSEKSFSTKSLARSQGLDPGQGGSDGEVSSLEPTVSPTKVPHEDSVIFRHRDLEFLLSENRVPAPQVSAGDDEEELAAVLQASTKAAPPKHRPAPRRTRLVSDLSDCTVDQATLPVQPAITSNVMPDKTVVKTSDIRVSERVPQSDMILDLSPCLYNELLNEIDETDIAFLDRNLFMGQEIKDVYNEIYKTIDHEHVKFTSDMEPPCPDLPTADHYFNSGIMRKKRVKNRRINDRIKVNDKPPWGQCSREEWEANVHFQGSESNGEPSEVFPSQLIKVPVFSDFDTNNFKVPAEVKSSREGKSYTNWLQWWKSIMSAEDYQKYLSIRESDYLALIFHLYDSEEDVDSCDERDVMLEQELLKEREKRDKLLQAMLEEKNKVVPGCWNANAIMMGGLGKDPDLEEGSLSGKLTPEKITHLAQSSSTLRKYARSKSAESSSTMAPKSVFSKESKTIVQTVSQEVGSVNMPSPALESKMLQDRLNNIWKKLEMPEDDRIDMTIKYCKIDSKSLKNVVDLWEQACNAISSREKLILELEIFEKDASDPQRLFGQNSKTSRILEEKKRSALHRRIKKCEKQVNDHVKKVHSNLGDTVTYQGRVYLDKMSRDLTEMLYWLQQERRQAALEQGGMVMVDLPPVSPLDLV